MSQLVRAHPGFFEFNEEFLIFLVDHTFSCRFGNFLYPCEKSRRSGKVMANTGNFFFHFLYSSLSFFNFFFFHSLIFFFLTNSLLKLQSGDTYSKTRKSS